ncbi:10440_t:CDS:2, partial [Funneliformis mosseae]
KISSSSARVSMGEPLKFNMNEYLEKRKLELAGDTIGLEELEKKVRQRMESELASVAKQEIPTTKTSTLNTGGDVSVNKCKNGVVTQKRQQATSSTSKVSGNVTTNDEEKKAAVKNERTIATATSKLKNTSSGSLPVNKEKQAGLNQIKSKSSLSVPKGVTGISAVINKGKPISKGIGGNLIANKVKQSIPFHLEKPTSLTSTSKSIGGNLPNNKGKQAVYQGKVTSTSDKLHPKQVAIKQEKTRTLSRSSNKSAIKSIPRLQMYVERWKLSREKDGKYKPLELFLPSEILNDKNYMPTVEQIAREFEFERLRRLLEQDKEKSDGDKKLDRKRIEHLNTRLEIAAFRNEKGPKKDEQIRAHIAFLNEKNFFKNKVTPLDVIENPNLLKKGFEQFQEQQRKKSQEKGLQRKDIEKQLLERKRAGETWERDLQRKEKFTEGRKMEKRSADKRRHQERVVETKRRQENFTEARRKLEVEKERARRQKSSAETEGRFKRVVDDTLRPGHHNVQKKRITNGNETLHKKRKFDERSEATSSSRVKRRNTGNDEFDIYRLDEETLKQNMSSIIHSLIRPGRRPIHGMVDDNDDDIMEVSGYQVLREEARSSRLAKQEDEEEERLEQQRRMKKKDKKVKR